MDKIPRNRENVKVLFFTFHSILDKWWCNSNDNNDSQDGERIFSGRFGPEKLTKLRLLQMVWNLWVKIEK